MPNQYGHHPTCTEAMRTYALMMHARMMDTNDRMIQWQEHQAVSNQRARRQPFSNQSSVFLEGCSKSTSVDGVAVMWML
jgi:hypothetical protein